MPDISPERPLLLYADVFVDELDDEVSELTFIIVPSAVSEFPP
jgi:hypothetical protein